MSITEAAFYLLWRSLSIFEDICFELILCYLESYYLNSSSISSFMPPDGINILWSKAWVLAWWICKNGKSFKTLLDWLSSLLLFSSSLLSFLETLAMLIISLSLFLSQPRVFLVRMRSLLVDFSLKRLGLLLLEVLDYYERSILVILKSYLVLGC